MSLPLPPPFIVGEIYADRVGEYKVVALEPGRVIFEYADGRRCEGSADQKALIYRNIVREKTIQQPSSPRTSQTSRSGGAEPSFRHDEIFPIIADIIEVQFARSRVYVVHDVIVDALLKNKEADPILQSCPQDELRTKSWWAHCMVAWFSKVFTDGRSDWGSRFERTKIDRKWAYKVLGR